MNERSIDELGPIDYLVVEFPAGQQNFTGEGVDQLLRLHDSGIIRVMDVVIIGKGEDGTVMAQELGDLDDMGEFARLETDLAETLAEEDVLRLGRPWSPEASAPCSSTRTSGPRASLRPSAMPAGSWLPRAGSRSRPSSPPSRRMRRCSSPKESEMPLRSSRLGKAAVVTAAVDPRPVAGRQGRRRRRRRFGARPGARSQRPPSSPRPSPRVAAASSRRHPAATGQTRNCPVARTTGHFSIASAANASTERRARQPSRDLDRPLRVAAAREVHRGGAVADHRDRFSQHSTARSRGRHAGRRARASSPPSRPRLASSTSWSTAM